MPKGIVCGLATFFTAVLSGQNITIYTEFEHPPSPLTVQHMKTELRDIMNPLLLQLEWRPLHEAKGEGLDTEVLVVSFTGKCHGSDLEGADGKNGPLGWTSVNDGEVLPFSHVDCDRIRSLLSAPAAAALPGEREHLLGRAMARVLAHEMYHVLTNSTRHATRGIAKSAYNSQELAGDHLVFDPRQFTRAMR